MHGARKEELAERGQGAEPDPYAPGVNVTSELTMMSDLLLAPAAALLTPETPLLIITHLSLQWVPFCALPLPAAHPASATPSSVRTGACLVDVHPISFAPSLTVYRHLVHRAALAAADTAPAPLDESLIVGGAIPSPSYELPDLPVRHSLMASLMASLTAPAEIRLRLGRDWAEILLRKEWISLHER